MATQQKDDFSILSASVYGRGMTRRDFLRSAGGGVAGLAWARGASARRQAAPLILGSGTSKYECIHDWLMPPDNIRFGDTQGVAQDAKGRIYVSHTVHPESQSDDAIVVFDEKGKFLTSWGARFKGGGHGIDVRREKGTEYLYHCDTAHRLVVKTDLDGKAIWEKGLPTESGKYGEKDPFVPTNVAFAPNGDFYIGDGYGSSWVHQYNAAGDYIRSFGGRGDGKGQFNVPHGLWVDSRGKEPFLAVADRENHRIQYLTLDGQHVRFDTTGMRRPCNLDFRRGVAVVPDLTSVVTLLDENNKVIASLGDGDPSNLRNVPRSQFIPGKFIHPHDAMFLKNGDILIAEWIPIGRITLLRKLA